MGTYDKQRDDVSTISLSGNEKAAAGFIPTARKFAEVLQGKLDLGANLGMDYKQTIALDDNTIMSVRLTPGVTNPTTTIEITSSLPAGVVGKQGELITPTGDCPRLPLSKPGARMFTHLFGHDTNGNFGFPDTTFVQTAAVKTSTPYITPTESQGSYCSNFEFPGEGQELFHDEVTLATPFQLMGRLFSTCYLHELWLGIVSPNCFLSFSEAVMPLNMPCDCNFQGSIFTPNPEALGPGNNFALCMQKNHNPGCYPNNQLHEVTWLVEGTVQIRPDYEKQTTEQGEPSDEDRDSIRPFEGEYRNFALIAWSACASDAEIVLMYPSGNCPAAVGFFFGGDDGLRNASQPAFSSFVTAFMCDFDNPCILGDTPFVPNSNGAYFIGAERQALAYTGCLNSQQITGSDRGSANLAGRSFWFELDRAGFPNRIGYHNGPQGRDDLVGAADLTFN